MRSSSTERAIFSARRCATLCEPHTVTRRPSSSVVAESSRASAVPHTAQVVWLGAVLRSRLPIRMGGRSLGARAKADFTDLRARFRGARATRAQAADVPPALMSPDRPRRRPRWRPAGSSTSAAPRSRRAAAASLRASRTRTRRARHCGSPSPALYDGASFEAASAFAFAFAPRYRGMPAMTRTTKGFVMPRPVAVTCRTPGACTSVS